MLPAGMSAPGILNSHFLDDAVLRAFPIINARFVKIQPNVVIICKAFCTQKHPDLFLHHWHGEETLLLRKA